MKNNAFFYYMVMGVGLFVILVAAYLLNNREKPAVQSPVQSHSVPPQGVPHVTRDELYNLFSAGKYSFIEFGGRTCIPCQKMQPILAQLDDMIGSTVNIYNVYLEDDPSLARDFRVNLIPTQIIFDNEGNEISRRVGYWEKSSLIDELRKLGIM